MKDFKTLFDELGVGFIEKFGYYANPLILKFKKENNRLLVFYFHGLFENESQKNLSHIDPQNNMTVSQFIDFIKYFSAHKYKFILPEDLNKKLDEDVPYAMITFDDGYFNNKLAIDILNRYNVPGVFFISTKNILENKSYWWDVIYKYRIREGRSIENIRCEQKSLKIFKYDHIKNYIIKNFGINAFNPWSDIDRPFNEKEVKLLAQTPNICFANHTHRHSILTNCDKKEIKEELQLSNAILQDLTGKKPLSIAFPNGNFNPLILELAEEEGFQYAFTTEPTRLLLSNRSEGMLCLGRLMTNTSKIEKFGSFCRLGYESEVTYWNIKMQLRSIIKGKKNN